MKLPKKEKAIIKQSGKARDDAWVEIYARYLSRAYAMARRLLHHHPDAADVAIRSIQKLFERYDQFESIPEMEAFLIKVTRNACVDIIRKMKRQKATEEKYVNRIELTDNTTGDQLIEKEQQYLVQREIAGLPPRCREVFELLYLEGRSTKEVARLLGISPDTVRVQKMKAIRLMQNKFNQNLS